MLKNLLSTLDVNSVLQQSSAEAAAWRLAAGTMKVRRDANPRRRHAVTFTQLGKLNPIGASHVRELISCFGSLAIDTSSCHSPCIVGLAESGIVPSFAMHRACIAQGRNSRWFCTSRIDQGGPGFLEPHSHAPHHFLPPDVLSQPIDELWIVEDEITTGRTLANLLRCIHESRRVRLTRVFAVLDARTAPASAWPAQASNAVAVHSILRAGSGFWEADVSHAMTMQLDDQPRQLVMGESIAKALPLLLSGDVPRLQHVTLSPWMIDHRYIFSRKEVMAGFYLYNGGEVGSA